MITGNSVDWYAKAYSSKTEALERLTLELANPPMGQTSSVAPSKQTQEAREQSHGAPVIPNQRMIDQFDSQLTGLWKWHVEGKPATGGAFFFASDQGIAQGASFVELPITGKAANTADTSQAIMKNPFVAFIGVHKGKHTVEFEIRNGARRSVSTATFESNDTMSGETTQQTSDGGTIRYEWRATKQTR